MGSGFRVRKEKETIVKRLAILLALLMLVAAVAGCSATAERSTKLNMTYMRDDAHRFAGLDQPSGLHARDNEPWDAYEPYRAPE